MYTISRGDFGALGLDNDSVFMLSRAYKMMEEIPGSWDVLARPDIPGDNGFMFSSNPLLNEISEKIGGDPECGHSGSSYGWTMRNMESIAKKGWNDYCLLFPKRKQGPTPEEMIAKLNAQVAALEAENAELRNRIASRPSVTQEPATVDNFITQFANFQNCIAKYAKNDEVMASPATFAEALSRDPAMRAMIPDIDEQAEAMKKFSEGKLSYAEMRSLCG